MTIPALCYRATVERVDGAVVTVRVAGLGTFPAEALDHLETTGPASTGTAHTHGALAPLARGDAVLVVPIAGRREDFVVVGRIAR